MSTWVPGPTVFIVPDGQDLFSSDGNSLLLYHRSFQLQALTYSWYWYFPTPWYYSCQFLVTFNYSGVSSVLLLTSQFLRTANLCHYLWSCWYIWLPPSSDRSNVLIVIVLVAISYSITDETGKQSLEILLYSLTKVKFDEILNHLCMNLLYSLSVASTCKRI